MSSLESLGDMLREICQGNQKGNQEEPIAKVVREL